MKSMVRSSWVAVSGTTAITLLLWGTSPISAHAQSATPEPPAGTPEVVTPAVKVPEANAPTNQPAATSSEKVQRMKPIIVTGSNIPTLEDQPIAPVMRIDKESIDRSGASTVAEVLQRIPQNNGNQSFSENGQAGSFTPGTAAVSLRGFGPQATLVLLNGRRVTPSPFADNFNGVQANFVDINTIPASAIERVEVEMDSGSAIYGSDAIAGVINVILRTDYNGLEIGTSYGNAARSDIGEQTDYLVAGLSGGKSTMMIFLDYFSRNSSFLRDRPISKTFAFTSSNGPQATFINPNNPNQLLYTPPGGATGVGDLSTSPTIGKVVGANIFNTNIRTVDNPGTTRYGGYVTYTYDITDNIQFFCDAAYRRIQTQFSINPTPIIGDQDGWAIGPNNPYNPFPGQSTLVKWRLLQTGPRINNIDTDTARVLPGLRFKIGESWNIETAYLYSFVKSIDNGKNYLGSNQLAAALNDSNPVTALNPLAGAGQPQNQNTIDGLRVRTTRQGEYDYWDYDIRANGNTFNIPAGPISIALGAETRWESYSDTPDSLSDAGLIVSQGGNHLSTGRRDSDAIFWEGIVPLVSGQNRMPGIYSLQAQGAGRFEYYSDFGTTTKPKAGIKWQPIKEMAIRFSYSQGFQAPTLSELFQSASVGFQQGIPDLARCSTATGGKNPSPGAFSGPDGPNPNDFCTGRNYQYRNTTGGNPNLVPENSESYYTEMMYQPPFVKGLTLTVGWAHIKIKDVITAPNPAFVVANPNLFPGAVTRDAANPAFAGDPGQILNIDNTLINVNQQQTDAIDFHFNYVRDTEAIGNFTADFIATYTPTFTETGEDGSVAQLAGNGSFPRLRGSYSTFWQGPKGTWAEKLGFGPTFNFISSYTDTLYPPHIVNAWWDCDVQATYQLPWQINVTLGILNVADRNAPRSYGQNGEGYDPAVYDNRGRWVYARVSKVF
jgi:outer membrane receptor protein involved in Fe transport